MTAAFNLLGPKNGMLGCVALDAVAALMVTIGEEDYSESLIAILRSIADFDGAAAYFVRGEEPNEDAVRLWGHGILPEHRLVSAHVAIGRRAFARGLVSRGDLRNAEALSGECSSLHVFHSLCDDFVGFFVEIDDTSSLVVSIWRARGAGQFSLNSIAGYRALEPIVRASAVRHIRLLLADGNLLGENEQDRRPISHQHEGLTVREQQIVHMVFDGHCSESIAHTLNISYGTVKIHKKNIYRKLQISSESELLRMLFGRK